MEQPVTESTLAGRETHQLAADMRRHWWYRGRRVVVRSLMRRAGIPRDGRVLDFGCGTGHMGAVLSEFGTVVGVEGSEHAIELGDHAEYAQVACSLGPDDERFPHGPYDVIVCLDVLEHVEDDAALLAGLAGELAAGGAIVVSVPMGPELFGPVDEAAGHVRRYTRKTLEEAGRQAGLRIVATTGYVVSLLPVARRQRRRVAEGSAAAEDEHRIPAAPVNGALSAIACTEGYVSRWVSLPEGLSLVAVMRPSAELAQ